MNAWRTSNGDSAKIAASYGRRPAACAVAAVVTSPHALEQQRGERAEDDDLAPVRVEACTARVRSAVTSMKPPVSTGYSTAVSR